MKNEGGGERERARAVVASASEALGGSHSPQSISLVFNSPSLLFSTCSLDASLFIF